MSVQCMEQIGVVVNDLEAAVAFFVELGLREEGKALVQGQWVDRVLGLDDVQVDVVMMRTPDGRGRLELTKFRNPMMVETGRGSASPNTLGICRVMFTVKEIEAIVDRLRAIGAELLGELQQVGDRHRLCYVRGPEDLIIVLSEQFG
jgi:catechol 2,3-dioxygenase-like lactoylglutathione lyase family enzyme